MTLIRVTAPDREIAARIAEALVGERLCASAHVSGPSDTVYWWRDKIHHGSEYCCEARTRGANTAATIALIEQLHPYEVPEIFVAEVRPATAEYERWLNQYTRKQDPNHEG